MEDKNYSSNKKFDRKLLNCINVDYHQHNMRPTVKNEIHSYNRLNTDPHGSVEIRSNHRINKQRCSNNSRLQKDIDHNENQDLSTTLKKNIFIDSSSEQTVQSPTMTIKNMNPYTSTSIKRKISNTIRNSVSDNFSYKPQNKVFDVNALYQGNLRESLVTKLGAIKNNINQNSLCNIHTKKMPERHSHSKENFIKGSHSKDNFKANSTTKLNYYEIYDKSLKKTIPDNESSDKIIDRTKVIPAKTDTKTWLKGVKFYMTKKRGDNVANYKERGSADKYLNTKEGSSKNFRNFTLSNFNITKNEQNLSNNFLNHPKNNSFLNKQSYLYSDEDACSNFMKKLKEKIEERNVHTVSKPFFMAGKKAELKNLINSKMDQNIKKTDQIKSHYDDKLLMLQKTRVLSQKSNLGSRAKDKGYFINSDFKALEISENGSFHNSNENSANEESGKVQTIKKTEPEIFRSRSPTSQNYSSYYKKKSSNPLNLYRKTTDDFSKILSNSKSSINFYPSNRLKNQECTSKDQVVPNNIKNAVSEVNLSCFKNIDETKNTLMNTIEKKIKSNKIISILENKIINTKDLVLSSNRNSSMHNNSAMSNESTVSVFGTQNQLEKSKKKLSRYATKDEHKSSNNVCITENTPHFNRYNKSRNVNTFSNDCIHKERGTYTAGSKNKSPKVISFVNSNHKFSDKASPKRPKCNEFNQNYQSIPGIKKSVNEEYDLHYKQMKKIVLNNNFIEKLEKDEDVLSNTQEDLEKKDTCRKERDQYNQELKFSQIKKLADFFQKNSENPEKKGMLIAKLKELKKTMLDIDGLVENYNNEKKELEIEKKAEKLNKQSIADKKSSSAHFNIKDYEITRVIGKGTFAEVKEAIHKKTKEKMAFKIYDKMAMLGKQKLRNVYNEIDNLYILKHDNIVKVFGVSNSIRQIVIALEYAGIVSLHKLVSSSTKKLPYLDEETGRNYFKQIVEAIQYCHKKKRIVHRDLKLDNIMVYNNKIKIIDFGFSTKMKDAKKDFSYCGTPCYMAPEIISKRSNMVHSESDIWAMGVLLYRMVIGTYPFRGKSQKELQDLIVKSELKYPTRLSNEQVDLLKKLQKKKITDRIKIDEIMTHPWLTPISKGNEVYQESVSNN